MAIQAIQKHNTYYDASKPNSGIYFYDQNGDSKQLPIDKICSAGKGISLKDNIISYSGKDEPISLQGYNGVNTTPDPSDPGKWNIGLKDNYDTAITSILPNTVNKVNELTAQSANWKSSYDTLTANSAYWLKEDALAGLAAKTELKTASSVLTAQTDYLSGVINNKLDTSAFNTYTANADITPYSGRDPILVKNHTISLTAEYALSSAVYSKDEIDGFVEDIEKQLANLGYHRCTLDEVKANGEPDEVVLEEHEKLSTKLIYLVKDDTASTPDQYREWIYENDNDTIIWTCIGDTSINLDGYATETWVKDNFSAASALSVEFMKYLNKTDFNTYSANVKTQIDAKLDTNTFDAWSAHTFDDYAKTADVNEKFDQTSAWAKDTFQKKGNYVSATDLDNYYTKSEVNTEFTETSSWANETFQPIGEYVSATKLDDYYTKTQTDTEITKQIDDLSATVSSEYAKKTDIHEYTAGPNIEINDYIVSGRDWTPELDEKADITYVEDIAETLANGIAKKLDTSAFNDYSAHALDDYYKKSETSANEEIQIALNKKQDNLTEEQLSAISSVSAIQSISGNWVTSAANVIADPDLAYFLVKDGDSSKWNGVDLSTLGKTYKVLSTDDDLLKITSSIDGNNTTYTLSAKDWSNELKEKVDVDDFNSELDKIAETFIDLSATVSSDYVKKGEIPEPVFYDISAKYAKAQSGTYNDKDYYFISGAEIVGNNGISAEYNENTNSWEVGLEDYNDIGFAKYSTNSNTYTTSAVVTGYQEDLNVNPTKITLTNDQILLKKGFYHVDVQTNFAISTADNNYYDVLIKSIPNAASITQMIDTSYTHTETVDLSFDIRITNDDTPIEISVENYKVNETFAISNLNIHEIVSMPSQIETDSNNYQAGDGISISNDTIEAKLGNGLEFDESNAIQVKLGEGLAFTDDQGIKAISIDPAGNVAEVVETVETLQDELDTKITDNFPPAMITLADLQVATGTQYAPSNGGMLIGYLFTCPITHNIYVNNEKYQTKIGIYTKQWSGTNNRVILGIYEYNPDYVNPDTQQVGKTEALCDTGIIELQQGYAEYEIKNVGEKTTPIMTPGKFYYATIYLSYLADDTNGITLFGAPGYNTQVNNLKPGITITNVNCIHASLYEGLQGYSPNLNFDQMGFSWQFDSYPPNQETDPSTSQNIVEAHAAGRPYFAIRNVKKVGN